jgi:hypothetical protein
MKLPAVSIASVFASGIAIGLWPMVANRVSSREFYFGEFGSAFVLIAAAIFLVSRQYLRGATILSLAAWLVLGFFGATIAQEPKPQNYILKVIQSGELDLHTPLRWHGVLRDEPATLPWGVSYEIELTSVDYQEHSISVPGGLRASYTQRAEDMALPSVRAGDQVSLVAQARLPQLFRDEGAFDRCAYLRSQGIDLTAALRSTELLERIASAKPSPRTVLAAVRRKRRETLASMFPDAPEEAAVLRAMRLGDRGSRSARRLRWQRFPSRRTGSAVRSN